MFTDHPRYSLTSFVGFRGLDACMTECILNGSTVLQASPQNFASLGLELGGALGVLAEAGVDVHFCFHTYQTLGV